MPNLRTEVAGRSVCATCAGDVETHARWFLDRLHAIHAQGGSIEPGLRIGAGWTVLTLRAGDPGSLQLVEPDFRRDAFTDETADISEGLRTNARMRDVLARVGAEGAPTSFQDKVVVGRGALEARSVVVVRSEPEPGDSGWFIGERGREYDVADLESVYAVQVWNRRPALVDVMWAPADYLFVFDGDEIVGAAGPDNEPVAV